MDLDALHRHMTEFKTMKPRLLKMLEFVEAIMTSGSMPSSTPAATVDPTVSDQIGTLRQDVTKLDDRIDVLEKFKEDVLPVLDKVPAFLELMTKLEGFDPAATEERLTTVEGSVQELAAALDPTGDEAPKAASGSDGATPGQGAAPAAPADPAATGQPAAAPAAPAAS